MSTTIQPSSGQQQKFRITPHDLQVLEGSEALLRCEVSNLAGQVQWTKDGFALGKLFQKFVLVIRMFCEYHICEVAHIMQSLSLYTVDFSGCVYNGIINILLGCQVFFII